MKLQIFISSLTNEDILRASLQKTVFENIVAERDCAKNDQYLLLLRWFQFCVMKISKYVVTYQLSLVCLQSRRATADLLQPCILYSINKTIWKEFEMLHAQIAAIVSPKGPSH